MSSGRTLCSRYWVWCCCGRGTGNLKRCDVGGARARLAGEGRDLGRKRVERGEGENHMKVLVSAASRHGATSEIADELGKMLHEALHERGGGGDDVAVDVLPAERVSSVEEYDAVVLGSAVYAGHWLEP